MNKSLRLFVLMVAAHLFFTMSGCAFINDTYLNLPGTPLEAGDDGEVVVDDSGGPVSKMSLDEMLSASAKAVRDSVTNAVVSALGMDAVYANVSKMTLPDELLLLCEESETVRHESPDGAKVCEFECALNHPWGLYTLLELNGTCSFGEGAEVDGTQLVGSADVVVKLTDIASSLEIEIKSEDLTCQYEEMMARLSSLYVRAETGSDESAAGISVAKSLAVLNVSWNRLYSIMESGGEYHYFDNDKWNTPVAACRDCTLRDIARDRAYFELGVWSRLGEFCNGGELPDCPTCDPHDPDDCEGMCLAELGVTCDRLYDMYCEDGHVGQSCTELIGAEAGDWCAIAGMLILEPPVAIHRDIDNPIYCIQGEPQCGNGILEEGEQCERYPSGFSYACRIGQQCVDCMCTGDPLILPICGNGIREPGEQCECIGDICFGCLRGQSCVMCTCIGGIIPRPPRDPIMIK